ncbi:MAG: thymidylate kinase, partial [Clostridia bacterium]|nr:thymidylate kinase [Clostridia bacterium]
GARLMADRLNKSTGGEQKDIHESDRDYLEKSYKNAVYVAENFGWQRISCVEDGKIRAIEDIHNDIYNIVKELIA